MAFKISYDQLQTISKTLASGNDNNFTVSLQKFLSEKQDDYYFYGRASVCSKYIEINITQLRQITTCLNVRKNHDVYFIINSLYKSADVSGQKTVFLYGRKNQK